VLPKSTGVACPDSSFTSPPAHDTSDDEGVELDNVEAARCHAVTMIAEVLCEHLKKY
jgi:hypothetical protein